MDWLAERVLKRVRRRRHAFTVKLLGRHMMSSTEESWREVERRFKSGEGGADGNTDESEGDNHPNA